jgi:hypothetical protein
MNIHCSCGKVWQSGDPVAQRCDLCWTRTPGHTVSGEPAIPALAHAIVFGARVLYQRLRLAWHRFWAVSHRPVGPGDPYRKVAPGLRFELHVGDDVLEAATFEGIIAQMRAMGCTDSEVIQAALVTHRTPRGGRVECWNILRIEQPLSAIAAKSEPRRREPPLGPSPRAFLD